MITKGIIKKNEYFDSVSLMITSQKIKEESGIIEAICIMGTKENRSILLNSGLYVDEFYNSLDSDLLIAVKAENDGIADGVLNRAVEFLAQSRSKISQKSLAHKSLGSALNNMSDANLVLISIPGKYVLDEAMKALKNGLNVMIFSDNVSIEDEILLKEFARQKNLFVMGPDCGTAIINGVPLCFANEVNKGNIGIVSAAGTGLQEVSVIISNNGGGISHAIGTGGRDVKKDVDGIMFIEGINGLIEDENTDIILLISKKPDEAVLLKIEEKILGIKKPVVTLFLGDKREKRQNIFSTRTLEEAALTALYLSHNKDISLLKTLLDEEDEKIKQLASECLKSVQKNQKYIRGLFSGGTLCQEAQLIIGENIADLYSNSPIGGAKKIENAFKSYKNTIVDLGDDEFTRGKPHPMIDYSIRKNRIMDEARDPETLVILLDVVLGYSAHLHPEDELAPVIVSAKKENKYIIVICSITGTDQDPQNKKRVESELSKAGAIVLPTNARACKLVAYIAKAI